MRGMPLTLAFQPIADDFLGPPSGALAATQRIDVGGVEEIYASGPGRIENRVASRFIALQTECHRIAAPDASSFFERFNRVPLVSPGAGQTTG